MKKVTAILSSLSYLLLPSIAFAAVGDLKVTPPTQGYSNLGAFVTNMLTLAFGLAVLVVLVMLVWGAFEWITSGGDKDAVSKARNRIINALIGLAVLAVAYALTRVAGQFLGFDITRDIPIPTPPPFVP